MSSPSVPRGLSENRQRKRRFEVHGEARRPYIDDDDFHWDALLSVQGDFENHAEKRRYLKAIAEVLSNHEDEIPHCPRRKP